MPQPHSNIRKQQGFSLLELLTVVTVMSILAAVALPAFAHLIRSNRIVSASNSLLSMLMLARSEAIKRHAQITLCKSKDGASCSSSSEVAWSEGIIIFVDSNTDRELDGTETVIRTESPFSAADTITLSSGNTLSYRANGSSSSGTFTVSSGEIQRRVIVSFSGRPRIK